VDAATHGPGGTVTVAHGGPGRCGPKSTHQQAVQSAHESTLGPATGPHPGNSDTAPAGSRLESGECTSFDNFEAFCYDRHNPERHTAESGQSLRPDGLSLVHNPSCWVQ
jgi:hypothetical protein